MLGNDCHELVLAVYPATQQLPRPELYGLTSQIRRAAVSEGANIAEGAAKRGPRETALSRHFLRIVVGGQLPTPPGS